VIGGLHSGAVAVGVAVDVDVAVDVRVVVRVVGRVGRVMVRMMKAGGCDGAVHFEGVLFRVCRLLDGT
jgi:hypothetical protein